MYRNICYKFKELNEVYVVLMEYYIRHFKRGFMSMKVPFE